MSASSPNGFFDSAHMRLPSRLEEMERVVEVTQQFAARQTEDEDLVYRVLLLTTEAVTNAMEHGNRLDPEKEVILSLSRTAAGIEVVVEDAGAGFRPAEHADPLQEENRLLNHGRGLFLIEQMADEWGYEDEGRRLRMFFNFPA